MITHAPWLVRLLSILGSPRIPKWLLDLIFALIGNIAPLLEKPVTTLICTAVGLVVAYKIIPKRGFVAGAAYGSTLAGLIGGILDIFWENALSSLVDGDIDTFLRVFLDDILGYTLVGLIGTLLVRLIGPRYGLIVYPGDDNQVGSRHALAPDEHPHLAPFPDRERKWTLFITTFEVMGHVFKGGERFFPGWLPIPIPQLKMFDLSYTCDCKYKYKYKCEYECFNKACGLFNRGKQWPDYPLESTLRDLSSEFHRFPGMARIFLKIQFQAAEMEGGMDKKKYQLMMEIAGYLGLSYQDFVEVERLASPSMRDGVRVQNQLDRPTLDDAYAVLGVSFNASDDEVEEAYYHIMGYYPEIEDWETAGLPCCMNRAVNEHRQQITAIRDMVRNERASSA